MYAVFDVDVDVALLGQICGLQLDMVFVVPDAECTLKQRLWAIPSHGDSGPARRGPSPLARADQGSATEDLVFMSLDRLAPAQGTIWAYVLHVSIVGQDVVIWLEF